MINRIAACCLLCIFALGLTPALAASETSAEIINAAPIAENLELETYRGVSVGGRLSAHDPDGDEVTFELATEPMKGTVQLSADGYFVYTPEEGKRGKDYFGFRAVDSQGNASQEATAIIKLLRQKTAVTYSDMTGSASEYAATALTEAGVFTAETLGDDYVFAPAETVTRGEFLAMCMTAADCKLLKGVHSTGFLDDGDIAAWLKPYVATALMNGQIQGIAAETGALFQPDAAITMKDACVLLNAVLGLTDVVSAASYVNLPSEDSAWVQAAANLTACRVMPLRWDDWEQQLSRSQAAEMLLSAMALLESR